jgi:hypothetical protein
MGNAGIDVEARIHQYDDAFPAERLPSNCNPLETWGGAIDHRIAGPEAGWRTT